MDETEEDMFVTCLSSIPFCNMSFITSTYNNISNFIITSIQDFREEFNNRILLAARQTIKNAPEDEKPHVERGFSKVLNLKVEELKKGYE